MKIKSLLVFSFSILMVLGCAAMEKTGAGSDLPQLELAFSDAAWDGKNVPEGQQCQRFGGKNPSTPGISVKNIPEGADMILMEYSDRSYARMDDGGHGKIGYKIKMGTKEVVVPSVPGHSFEVPEGFVMIEPHRGGGWDKAGAYMPPCSGGRRNAYYVTVYAIKTTDKKHEYAKLAEGVLEMGRY